MRQKRLEATSVRSLLIGQVLLPVMVTRPVSMRVITVPRMPSLGDCSPKAKSKINTVFIVYQFSSCGDRNAASDVSE